jgi:hypothetical protein
VRLAGKQVFWAYVYHNIAQSARRHVVGLYRLTEEYLTDKRKGLLIWLWTQKRADVSYDGLRKRDAGFLFTAAAVRSPTVMWTRETRECSIYASFKRFAGKQAFLGNALVGESPSLVRLAGKQVFWAHVYGYHSTGTISTQPRRIILYGTVHQHAATSDCIV